VLVEGHGREASADGQELSGSVGWFTRLAPLKLVVPQEALMPEWTQHLNEALQQARAYGQGYGLLRWVRQAPALVEQALPEISFNYLGQMGMADDDAGPTEEERGAERAADNPRSAVWDITAGVAGGELLVEWAYSREQYRAETIQAMGQAFLENLEALGETTSQVETAVKTGAEEFGWDQNDVKDLLDEIDHLDG
jgi:non-ribosomal peptide synthase protein (TIGR01720 family)